MLHIILLLMLGQAQDFPADPVQDAQNYLIDVAKRMPAWDADVWGMYERAEIATVKRDILKAHQDSNEDDKFLKDVEQLHKDVDSMVALDDIIRTRYIN